MNPVWPYRTSRVEMCKNTTAKKRKPWQPDEKEVIEGVRYRTMLLPKSGPEKPQLNVLFDSKIEKHLQRIVIQCIS